MFKLPRYAGHPTIPAQPKRSADKQAPSLPPLVSIIIAAKEEESTIADTVKHLLDQTYPRIEIIAVNDRSRDSTGRKLDELRRWSENRGDLHIPVRIIHITSLPSGWIGKNHALYQGYAQARGKYLLFTDADVKFAPNTVSD
ncbi:glycosyltransferase, partial [Escherichia coli]